MDYKQVLFYLIAFIIGLIIGKTIKLNISTRGCPVSKETWIKVQRMLNSESSEDYI